jgi:hypothetical protein
MMDCNDVTAHFEALFSIEQLGSSLQHDSFSNFQIFVGISFEEDSSSLSTSSDPPRNFGESIRQSEDC